MELRERAEKAVRDACDALGEEPLSKEDEAVVAQIIERAMQDAIREAARESGTAAEACCSHDSDMAHKIKAEIERANKALIANLSALR
ncbi:MAG: hypothetical protein QNJ94_10345 [Alphaproteobacteria bacterium]|nr:hypothetical protein [Alphaproteobacteria bacterium]